MGLEFEYQEGATPLDPDEAEGLIPTLSTQRELNEFEARNIVEAILWAHRSTKIRRSLLDQETLRVLHKAMFGKTWRWAGTYRQSQKSIGCEAWRIVTEMRLLTDDVRFWIDNQAFPPDEIAARFHHRLSWIHPFPNGNGRFARLATDLLCQQRGWLLSNWGSSNLTNASDIRSAYIESLRAADAHDHGPLLLFMFPR